MNRDGNDDLIEAFLSVPTVGNYLRCLYFINDLSPYESKIKRRISAQASEDQSDLKVQSNDAFFDKDEELEVFQLKKDSQEMIRFLLGDFKGEHLSSHFFNHKYVVDFLFGVLSKDQHYLRDSYYDCLGGLSSYFNITPESFFKDNTQEHPAVLVKEILDVWKSSVNITPEIEAFWLDQCAASIASTTDYVLSNKYRNAYDSCARLIAALGEVEESRGIHQARENRLREYDKEYSRYARFRSSLKKLGMTL